MGSTDMQPKLPPRLPRLFAHGRDANGRLPDIAHVTVEVDLLRKNERTPANDELSDDEADAFGYC